jgi:hypothetical protein
VLKDITKAKDMVQSWKNKSKCGDNFFLLFVTNELTFNNRQSGYQGIGLKKQYVWHRPKTLHYLHPMGE